jgi:AraC-like DNA-binding protein
MIWETKAMIAGCIDRIRQDGCGDCDRRDLCASLFSGAFARAPRRAPPAAGEQPFRAAPFFAFLGEVAKAFEGRMKPRETPLRREVETRMESLLASGTVRIDAVARDLGLSRQTLYRRLKAEGFTFEQLLDGLRRRLARRFLREGLSVKEAAYRLGFSDPAAFSRAYKRWTGNSPTAGGRGPRQPG